MGPGRRSAFALALALCGTARAEQGEDRPGRYKLGPLYLTPRLELKNAGVDTNVFATRTGTIPDSSAVLSPSLEGVLPVGRRLRLAGEGVVDLNYFRQERAERSADYKGEGRVALEVGAFTLNGAGGGGQTRQRFTIEIDKRLRRQQTGVEAGLEWRLTSKLRANLSGSDTTYEHESLVLGSGNDIRDLLDRNARAGTAQLRYRLTAKTTLIFSAEAREDRFLRERRPGAREARSYRYLGGFETGRRALIGGQLLAGLREFPGSPGAPAYRGPVAQVDASLRMGRIGRLGAYVNRDIEYAVTPAVGRAEQARNSQIVTLTRGELALDLPLELVGVAHIERLDSQLVLPSATLGQEGAQGRGLGRVWTVGGSLLREFRQGVHIGGTVAWTFRDSPVATQSFRRWVYGVQALITP